MKCQVCGAESGKFPPVRRLWKTALDRFVLKLRHQGYSDTPYRDRSF